MAARALSSRGRVVNASITAALLQLPIQHIAGRNITNNSTNSRDPTFDDRDDNVTVKQETAPSADTDAKPAAATKRERENDDAGDKDAKKVKTEEVAASS